MFQGQAKAALELWQSVVPEFKILEYAEFTEGEMTGQVMSARISIGGSEWMLNDSPPVHDFTFTPSASFYIECDDETQLRELAEELGDQIMMPIDDYGFGRLFTWIADPFGVSWQLNLAE